MAIARGGPAAAVVLALFACRGGAPPPAPPQPGPEQPQPEPQPPQQVSPQPPACVPTTCAAIAASCGTFPDGCGGTLSCAGCGPATPPSGSLQWAAVTEAPVLSITSDGVGRLAVLRGDISEKTITRYDGAGNVVWSRVVGDDAVRITLESSGAILIHGGYEDFNRGPRIDRLSPDGASITNAVPQGTDVTAFTRVSAGANGGWVYARSVHDGQSTIALHRADGSIDFFTESDALPVLFQAVALDPAGNVIAGGYAGHAFTFGGRTYQQGVVLMKLDARLQLQWIQPLTPAGGLQAIATTDRGTVVALGKFGGSVEWGGAAFNGGDAVFVAEPSGEPRFFKALPPAAWHLAVDPAGKMTLGGTMPDCGVMLREIDLAGDELWTKTLTSTECPLTVEDVAVLRGSALAGGRLSGAADFGTGPLSGHGYFVDYAD